MDNIQGLNCQGDTFKVVLTAVSSSGDYCDITGPGLYVPSIAYYVYALRAHAAN